MGNSLEIEPATSGQPRQVWDRPPHGLGILEAFDTQSDLGRVSYTPPVLATTDLLDVTRALAEGQDAQAVAFFQQSAGSLRALVSSAELVFDGLRWLWDADELSTVDLDIALSKLLTAFRKVATPPAMAPTPKHTSIMVANAPWDPHFQHAGMAKDLLQAEGFDVALWLGQDENDLAKTVAAAQVDIVSFDVEPGDVIIHHVLTVHGAGGNPSERWRRAVSFRYCGDQVRYLDRAGAIPQVGTSHDLVSGERLMSLDYPVVWPKPWPDLKLADLYPSVATPTLRRPNG